MKMVALKKFIFLSSASSVIALCLSSTHASATLPDEQNQAPATLVSVRDAKALKTVNRLVVFISGAETDNAKVLQDALTIELRKLGWNVVSRLEVETAVARDFEEWASLPDSVKTQSQKKGDDAAVAELVNADAYLTGTILFGRQQYTNIDKQFNASAEKVVVTTVSFQIVNVAQRKTILEVVLGYINGQSEVYVAQDIRQNIEQILKK